MKKYAKVYFIYSDFPHLMITSQIIPYHTTDRFSTQGQARQVKQGRARAAKTKHFTFIYSDFYGTGLFLG